MQKDKDKSMSTNMVVKKSSSIVDLFLAGLQQQDPEHYEKLSEQGRKVAMVFQKKQSHQHGRDPSMIALELLDPERYKILSEQGRQLAMLFQRKKSHQLSHDKDHLYGMRQKPFKTELTVDPTLYNIIFFLAYM
ncbi:MAG: hypothetical protein ISP86_03660, partial [Shewanellaceae bacterium]|nr:hypothetical protein [Shewanellaceae bacterium]